MFRERPKSFRTTKTVFGSYRKLPEWEKGTKRLNATAETNALLLSFSYFSVIKPQCIGVKVWPVRSYS
jgi:hypothetical protein